MSQLPPAIRESEFLAIETPNGEEVRSRFTNFIQDLHSFLNQTSCLRDIQHTRHKRKSAFNDFATEPQHWYTYNTGGRNEAQFNIGMFPNYLRIGLGFEFMKKRYGKPDAVHSAYGVFRDVLSQHRQAFDRFAQENSLEVEWRPWGTTLLRYVPTQQVSRWLLRPKSSEWIFVGRLLRRREDAEILEDPARLRDVMESVFGGFRPLWEQAQIEARGIE